MDRDLELRSDDEGNEFEQRALLAGEIEIKDDEDLDRFEAVKGDTRVFSLSEYFAFFVMGLPMMWIWSVGIQHPDTFFESRNLMNAKVHDYPGSPLFSTTIRSKRRNTTVLPSFISGVLCHNDVSHNDLLEQTARTTHVYTSTLESSMWICSGCDTTHGIRN